MNANRKTGVLVSVLLALGTLHCTSSPFATGASIDTEYDFSVVKNLAFAQVPKKTLGSVHGKILRAAVEESLTARGFDFVAEDEAQLWVSYDVGVFLAGDVSWGQQGGPGQGRIIVRAIDPASGREVWYGWAEAHLRSQPDPENRIRKAVEALFEGRVGTRS